MIFIKYEVIPVGDHAIEIITESVINPENNRMLNLVSKSILNCYEDGIISIIPAYCTLLISYDIQIITYDDIKNKLEKIIESVDNNCDLSSVVMKIPVCYDEEFAPDIINLAKYKNLSVSDVIKYHTSKNYLIYFLGFLPGFAYMGSVNEKIAMPRKESPRLHIVPGSVGIAGLQTGFYPVDAPGGWQIIGRTPINLYDEHNPNLRYHPGDEIRFFSISKEEFSKIKQADLNHEYKIEVSKIG